MLSELKRSTVWAMLAAVASGSVFAADAPDDSGPCPIAQPLSRAVAPAVPGGPGQTAVNVTADRVDVDGAISVFTGNVEVRYEGETLYADRVVYDRARDLIEASGNVRVRNPEGDAIDTPFLQVQRGAGTGHTEAVTFRFRGDRARGDARRINFRSRNFVELDHTRYTTCPPGQDSWFIVARDIELDYENDVGTATNAYINFMHVPIFYWPYLSFPLSDARKSGFLAPYFGADRNSGVFVAAPYYLNLAPNYDATLTPRYLERRGMQMLGEGRYLGKNHDGALNADYVDDRAYGDTRWAMRYVHNYYFSPLWSAEANYNRVSDQQYLTDFAIGIANATPTHMPQKLETRYGNAAWRGLARAFVYQTVDATISQDNAPYSRLPEIEIVTDAPTRGGGARYEFGGSLIHFDHDTKVTGERYALYPAVSAPLRNSYGFLIPRAGLRFNRYSNLSWDADASPQVAVPVYSVDSGVIFERGFNLGDTRHTQTLEPRLFYTYVPYQYQDDLPNFDTGPQDFTYANLFRENRYFGGDRIGDTNHMVLGATTRLLASGGAEWLRLSLGQIHYFEQHQVLLPEERATYQPKDRSYIVQQARLRLGYPAYLRNDVQWDSYASRTRKSSTYLQYSPRPENILSIGHLYSNLPGAAVGAREEQVEVSTQWRVSSRWSVLGQLVYSLSSDANRESYAGFEYNACCWIGRSYVQQVIDPTGEQVNKIFFEFELGGLVRLGVPRISPLSRRAFVFQD